MDSFKVLDVGGKALVECVREGRYLYDSHELSRVLRYKQLGSLRKQTLTDWKRDFQHGKDYALVSDQEFLANYAESCPHLVPTRHNTRLFFTPEGVQKVCERTTKDARPLLSALSSRLLDTSSASPEPPSEAERMVEYQILQKLLEQLQVLEDPALIKLAVMAAETGLGKSLDGLVPTASKPKPVVKQAPNPKPPERFFAGDDYWSFTRIGEMAGGYTARQAGQAANEVAKARGYSPERIRQSSVPFNQFVDGRDTHGQPRRMVRYHTDFANEVIRVLRANYKPTLPVSVVQKRQQIPLLTPFTFED